ncbi:hypothetical protein V6U77_22615 [Micromonospora sp. CPCC 205546]|uniref:hypothetical protein n=1 Tax=Micromonospora sp. CPCC 205546 TaxID=3122397 RepID=UPI002FEF3AE9
MLTAAQVLAQNNFGDTRTGGLAGPMGLFLILVLATATVLLIRNMNSRLRRLPDRFSEQGQQATPDQADAAVVDPTEGARAHDSSTAVPTGRQQRRNG